MDEYMETFVSIVLCFTEPKNFLLCGASNNLIVIEHSLTT